MWFLNFPYPLYSKPIVLSKIFDRHTGMAQENLPFPPLYATAPSTFSSSIVPRFIGKDLIFPLIGDRRPLCPLPSRCLTDNRFRIPFSVWISRVPSRRTEKETFFVDPGEVIGGSCQSHEHEAVLSDRPGKNANEIKKTNRDLISDLVGEVTYISK